MLGSGFRNGGNMVFWSDHESDHQRGTTVMLTVGLRPARQKRSPGGTPTPAKFALSIDS